MALDVSVETAFLTQRQCERAQRRIMNPIQRVKRHLNVMKGSATHRVRILKNVLSPQTILAHSQLSIPCLQCLQFALK